MDLLLKDNKKIISYKYESHLYDRYGGYFYSPIILVRDNLKSLIIIVRIL